MGGFSMAPKRLIAISNFVKVCDFVQGARMHTHTPKKASVGYAPRRFIMFSVRYVPTYIFVVFTAFLLHF